MCTITKQTYMLEFKRTFPKDHIIHSRDIPLIMKCKNIDFGYVNWCSELPCYYYNDKGLMAHLIDNIIDITVKDGASASNFTLFDKVMCYSDRSSIKKYMLNNGYVNYGICHRVSLWGNSNSVNSTFLKYMSLINYLTNASFGRFKGYYNIEKYYYIVHIMLLIMKVQQKMACIGSTLPSLPPVVIKHLIIPCVYQ